jgi:hypothetical protein
MFRLILCLLMSIIVSGPAVAAPEARSLSYSLSSGQDIRQNVIVEPGEALVAWLLPSAISDGSTRLEAYLGTRRLDRLSGSPAEVLRWTLPISVGPSRVMVQLRFVCRSRNCRGTGQWVVSSSSHSPAPPFAFYVNQRSFQDESGFCRNDRNAITYDGYCMCSDAAAAMALTLAGGEDWHNAYDIALDILSETLTARIAEGGAQIRTALMDAIEERRSGTSCSETTIDKSAFEPTLKGAVRRGDVVLFRSKGFSKAGHYVAVLGYRTVGSDLELTVNDPAGRWLRYEIWDLNDQRASSSASSGVGVGVRYRLSSLRSEASIIVCSP